MTLEREREKRRKKGGRTPKQIHERRSLQAQRIDEALRAKTATSAGDWARDPSRSDLPGIDTPKGKEKTSVSKEAKVTKKQSSGPTSESEIKYAKWLHDPNRRSGSLHILYEEDTPEGKQTKVTMGLLSSLSDKTETDILLTHNTLKLQGKPISDIYSTLVMNGKHEAAAELARKADWTPPKQRDSVGDWQQAQLEKQKSHQKDYDVRYNDYLEQTKAETPISRSSFHTLYVKDNMDLAEILSRESPKVETPKVEESISKPVEHTEQSYDERGYDLYGNPTGKGKAETEPYWRVNHETDRVEIHFSGKPDEATRKQLKSNGWKWSPTNQAWQRKHTSNAEIDVRDFAKIKHDDVGESLSAQERFDRELDITQRQIVRNERRAISHMAKSESHKSRSDSISQFIPMGQPVLSGHHSEKRHRRDLDKIHKAEGKRFEEYDKAELAKSRVESAKVKHEKMSSDPQFAERKIKRLEVDERYYKKHGMSKEHKRVSEDLQVWRDHLKNLGGKKYTPEMIKKGDQVRFIGTDYLVERVNKKSVTITGWMGRKDWTYTVPYDKIKGHKKQEKKGE